MSDDDFEGLLSYLRETRGFDFSGYKRASLIRRFDRRMNEVGAQSVAEYRDRLELYPDEFTELFNTILINVTSFFRDEEPWEFLRTKILPELVAAREEAPIRVWSAGCASGKEAYSLAIAMAELIGVDAVRERVKIYATDVDDEALAEARAATYPLDGIAGVPEALLDRYFERTGSHWSFRKELRRSVIFGRNDLVQDAPISHIDLLLCRNTLMYFNAETQASIIRRLHFALNADGALFLGKAEMLLSHTNLFTPVDLKHRIFTKATVEQHRDRPLILGASTGAGAALTGRDSELARLRAEALAASPVAQITLDRESRLTLASHPANVMFDLSAHDIGRPFQDLEMSYRPAELRSAIQRAATERRTVWLRDVEWVRHSSSQWIDIQVVPLTERDRTLLGTTLVFHDVTRFRDLQRDLKYTHRQLETAYEELQSSNEELETTNEELQSTVEELETTNEELQSTNEELETMNQELQSMNDELQGSNDELRRRTDQVADLNDFMGAILTSLESAVIVVDRDLRIQVWNARCEELWGLRQEETVGSHLMAPETGFPLELLTPVLRKVLSDPAAGGEKHLHSAVNRRGKPVDLDVTVSPLMGTRTAGAAVGAIVFMDSPGSAT